MKSMTGYAYAESTTEKAFVSAEIKSVNSRYADFNINLPPFLGALEQEIRTLCARYIVRGKVDVYIRVKDFQPEISVETDLQAAKSYADALKKIAHASGLSETDISVGLIASREGVLTVNQTYDTDAYRTLIEPVFTRALKDFCADREREGVNLKRDILSQLAKLENCARLFEQSVPEMEEIFKQSLVKRFNELLGDKADEQRIMSETAAMLVKYTINEEVVRLLSHIEALKAEIEHNEAPGKKIDFICQELNREINTIGSKNQILKIGQSVIEAKDALENIREQSRNVE
ncbi:YicC/YloC family endoribonuclease [Treponema sp. HNW]|uniref:YicC/YloC family endoribonuclease n=1 Tax=Treponema sp. HNW TaxID=3116654 RepID=UPI003D0DAAE7